MGSSLLGKRKPRRFVVKQRSGHERHFTSGERSSHEQSVQRRQWEVFLDIKNLSQWKKMEEIQDK